MKPPEKKKSLSKPCRRELILPERTASVLAGGLARLSPFAFPRHPM